MVRHSCACNFSGSHGGIDLQRLIEKRVEAPSLYMDITPSWFCSAVQDGAADRECAYRVRDTWQCVDASGQSLHCGTSTPSCRWGRAIQSGSPGWVAAAAIAGRSREPSQLHAQRIYPEEVDHAGHSLLLCENSLHRARRHVVDWLHILQNDTSEGKRQHERSQNPSSMFGTVSTTVGEHLVNLVPRAIELLGELFASLSMK